MDVSVTWRRRWPPTRAGGGASPGFRLRRCDEEHGQMSCSESNDPPVLGPINKNKSQRQICSTPTASLNGTFQQSFCSYIIRDREDLLIKYCFDQHQWFLH